MSAPATRMRIADIAAPQAASPAISRERARHVFVGSRRSDEATGAIRVGPVTAGVGTVGVIMVSAEALSRSGARIAA